MSKLAAIFPGQGVQFVGMGKSFYDKYDVMKRTYKEANEILGYDIAKLCFEGNILKLNENKTLFPAILTTSIGIYRCFLDTFGIVPDYFMGHSLGEYSALTAGGIIRFNDILKIVELRGKLSTESSQFGTMSIIDNITEEKLMSICEELNNCGINVHISCFNSYKQFAVCGSESSILKLEERVLQIGSSVTPLINSGPLHSPCMEGYCEELREYISKCKINEGEYNLITNTNAKMVGYVNSPKVIDLIVKHLVSPVKWRQCIEEVCKYDPPIFVEMGAKGYIRTLVNDIIPNSKAYCFGVKTEREKLQQDNDLLLLKNYTNSFFDKVLTVGLTMLPNKNLNCNLEKLYEYSSEIRKLNEGYVNTSDTKKQYVEKGMKLFEKIMDEKNTDESEKAYWVNLINAQYIYCL